MTQFIKIIKGSEASWSESFYYFTFYGILNSDYLYSEKVSRLNRSPSGSICPYYYMDGELHHLKYGSYFKDKEKLFAVINAEEDFILKSPGQKNDEFGLTSMKRNLMMKLLMFSQLILRR